MLGYFTPTSGPVAVSNSSSGKDEKKPDNSTGPDSSYVSIEGSKSSAVAVTSSPRRWKTSHLFRNRKSRDAAGLKPSRSKAISSLGGAIPWDPKLTISDRQVYHFSEIVRSSFSTSAAVESDVQVTYRLIDLQGVASLTTSFDQYRFVRVETIISPRTTVLTSNSANQGMLASVVDYDGNNSTFILLEQYNNALVTQGNVQHYHSLSPCVLMTTKGSGGDVDAANPQCPWLDCAATTIVHYGVNIAQTVTDVVYTYDITHRYFVDFRNAF